LGEGGVRVFITAAELCFLTDHQAGCFSMLNKKQNLRVAKNALTPSLSHRESDGNLF
jgi:hypothetical protein